MLADSVLAAGVLLELAVGLLCLLAVRRLSVAAHRAGRALAARRGGGRRSSIQPPQPVPLLAAPVRLHAPAYGGGKRAPPAFG